MNQIKSLANRLGLITVLCLAPVFAYADTLEFYKDNLDEVWED